MAEFELEQTQCRENILLRFDETFAKHRADVLRNMCAVATPTNDAGRADPFEDSILEHSQTNPSEISHEKKKNENEDENTFGENHFEDVSVNTSPKGFDGKRFQNKPLKSKPKRKRKHKSGWLMMKGHDGRTRSFQKGNFRLKRKRISPRNIMPIYLFHRCIMDSSLCCTLCRQSSAFPYLLSPCREDTAKSSKGNHRRRYSSR